MPGENGRTRGSGQLTAIGSTDPRPWSAALQEGQLVTSETTGLSVAALLAQDRHLWASSTVVNRPCVDRESRLRLPRPSGFSRLVVAYVCLSIVAYVTPPTRLIGNI
jgi:hypothetical protein